MSTDDTRAGEVAAEEVEALARVIKTSARLGPFGPNTVSLIVNGDRVSLNGREADEVADAVLASDWLAAHDARVRAEADGVLGLQREVEAHGQTLLALDEARSERDRLQAWKDEALPVMSGLQELGRALGLGLGQQITARASVDVALDLRAERDRLAAFVADVDLSANEQAARLTLLRQELARTEEERNAETERADRLAAGVRELAARAERKQGHSVWAAKVTTDDLRALLAPADDGEVG